MLNRLFIVVILFCVVFSVHYLAQEETEKIKEQVSVVNIEVPVRIFYKGKAIDNLSKSDFLLYENKKPQVINGFFIKRKKIMVDKFKSSVIEIQKKETQFRYFVLIFRISDYNQDLKKGLDYVFNQILREDDQLMVFANNKSLSFPNLRQKEKIYDLLNRTIKEEARLAHVRQTSLIQKIESTLADSAQIWVDFPESVFAALDYVNLHLRIWRNYKKKYLTPDLRNYFYFANHLEKIKKEKWVINFYQFEMFPKLKRHGRIRRDLRAFANSLMAVGGGEWGKIILKVMNELDMEMNVATDFPVDDISKLFYKVSATFHSIFIRSSIEGLSKDFEYQQTATNIEKSLRDITKKTGGTLIASSNLEKALETIGEKENIYYVLTYAPLNPQKRGKIKIKIKNKKYKVIYDNNLRADYINEFLKKTKSDIPTIQIENLQFKEKKLSTRIEKFLIKKNKDNSIGKVSVHIRVLDQGNQTLFDQSKLLLPNKSIISLSIPFFWLKQGKYYIIVEVRDLNTGLSCMKYIEPKII